MFGRLLIGNSSYSIVSAFHFIDGFTMNDKIGAELSVVDSSAYYLDSIRVYFLVSHIIACYMKAKFPFDFVLCLVLVCIP